MERTEIIEKHLNNSITITETGCSIWLGCVNEKGYGRAKVQNKNYYVHRLAFEYYNKSIDRSLLVLHSCDIPCCINPAHLRQGTDKENRNDAVKRNRIPRGSQLHNTNLTEEQAREIKYSCAKQKYLAKKFNTSIGTISQIQTGKRWKHL